MVYSKYPNKWLSTDDVAGDLAQDRGEALVQELGTDNVAFVPCNVMTWNDQLSLFKTALSKSPSKTIDVVFANAGMNKLDE